MKAGITSYENAQYRTRRRWRSRLEPYAWVTPALVVFFIFTLLPLIVGFWLSFVSWDGITTLRWVGLQNYVDVFHDSLFWQAIEHNAIYAVGTVVGKIALSLVLAILLNQSLPGRAIFRTALFLPVVLSFVVVGLMWNWIYDYNFGLVNGMLGLIGLSSLKQLWLGNPSLALPALIVVDIWKWFGFHMVIFLAGLQSIPAELYEAARIDGANAWHSFWRITLPLLRPIVDDQRDAGHAGRIQRLRSGVRHDHGWPGLRDQRGDDGHLYAGFPILSLWLRRRDVLCLVGPGQCHCARRAARAEQRTVFLAEVAGTDRPVICQPRF